MKHLLLLLSFAICFRSVAQTTSIPLLEKRISIMTSQMPLKEVMNILEEQASFTFSYRSSIIDESKPVSIKADKRPLREILSRIFGNEIRFKEKGNYVILSEMKEEKKMVVGGYVENESGEPVKGATVYDESTLVSANTDEYGYYEMKVQRKLEPLQVSVHKSEYHDTLYPVKPESGALNTIIIREEPKDSAFAKAMNSAGEFAARQWNQVTAFVFPETPESINVDDTIYRHFQFSFVPYLGTNKKLCGNVINDWSFNLIGGYNMGVRKGELAGLFNVNRSDVRSAQLSGFANINGGNVSGFQATGFSNTNLGYFKGAQFAGFSNFNGGVTNGALFAGFANVNTDSTSTAQFSGFANINTTGSHGAFVSGFSNVNVGETDGVQVTGFANVATGNMKGFQLAGFSNVTTKEMDGVQLSGFCNYAKTVKGSQIGFMNICDSISGVPFGFMSYVVKGYHNVEVSTNDLYDLNLAFRTGIRPIYNIFSAGMDVTNTDTIAWSVGYGLGSSPKIFKGGYLNFELSSHYLSKGNWSENLSLDNQVYAGLDINIFKNVAITGGVIMHGYLTENYVLYSDVFNGYEPNIVEEIEWDDYNMKMWWGWKAGIRFSW